MVFLTMLSPYHVYAIDAVHVPTNAEPIGALNMNSRRLEWLVIVVCAGVVLAVADMNLDKALGL